MLFMLYFLSINVRAVIFMSLLMRNVQIRTVTFDFQIVRAPDTFVLFEKKITNFLKMLMNFVFLIHFFFYMNYEVCIERKCS